MSGGTAGAKSCPICSKPAAKPFTPFCSARCADVDLHRWLKGSYAIPARETDEDDSETASTTRGDDKPRQ